MGIRKRTQNTQTTRRIRRRAGNVATTPIALATPLFPPDFLNLYFDFKFTSGHRIIARASGVDDTPTGSVPDLKTVTPKTLVRRQNLVLLPARLRAACLCVVCEESASSAFKKAVCFRNPQLIASGKIRNYYSFSDSASSTSSSTSSESSKSSSNSSSNSSSYSSSGSSLGGRTSLSI